jgi:hypothetical protein
MSSLKEFSRQFLIGTEDDDVQDRLSTQVSSRL